MTTSGPALPNEDKAVEELGLRIATLERLDPGDIKMLTGNAHEEVVQLLGAATNGSPGELLVAWQTLRAEGIVGLRDGVWCMQEGETSSKWLARALGLRAASAHSDLTIDDRMNVLFLASLEGPVFSANSIARALELDEDIVIDFLDELQAESALDPIVAEIEHYTSVAGRIVWRYQLSSKHASVARLSQKPSVRREVARALARQIESDYADAPWVAVDELKHLYLESADRGAYFLLSTSEGVDPESARIYLETLLSENDGTSRSTIEDFDLGVGLSNSIQHLVTSRDMTRYVRGLRTIAYRTGSRLHKDIADVGLAGGLAKLVTSEGLDSTAPEYIEAVKLATDLADTSPVEGVRASAYMTLAQLAASSWDLKEAARLYDLAASVTQGNPMLSEMHWECFVKATDIAFMMGAGSAEISARLRSLRQIGGSIPSVEAHRIAQLVIECGQVNGLPPEELERDFATLVRILHDRKSFYAAADVRFRQAVWEIAHRRRLSQPLQFNRVDRLVAAANDLRAKAADWERLDGHEGFSRDSVLAVAIEREHWRTSWLSNNGSRWEPTSEAR